MIMTNNNNKMLLSKNVKRYIKIYGSFINDNEHNENPKDNPPKKQSNTGLIVGIVICIVVILGLVAVIVFLVIRNRNGNQKSMKEKEGELSLI